MSYRIAGIDVRKRTLAVVSDVEVEGEYHFERCPFGSNPADLRRLSEWLIEQQVEEVVMESTAQYWRPVWEEEGGPAVSKKSKQRRAARMIRELRSLGYRVQPASSLQPNTT
jgi:hypothetical protein